MWKDSIRNFVVIFQPNILRIVRFYVRHSAFDLVYPNFEGTCIEFVDISRKVCIEIVKGIFGKIL